MQNRVNLPDLLLLSQTRNRKNNTNDYANYVFHIKY